MKTLLGTLVPTEIEEISTHTFHWRVDATTLRRVRQAEAEGYEGMWIDSKLEVVVPEPPKKD